MQKIKEHPLQKQIILLLRGLNIFCFQTDVMDGLKFCTSQQARLSFINHHKAMGYVNGQSDLVIIFKNKVVFAEIKTTKGVQSKEQKKFQSIVESLGFQYVIFKSLDDVIFYIKENNLLDKTKINPYNNLVII